MSLETAPVLALCAADDVPVNGSLRIEPQAGLPALAVFNREGLFYVTDDRCTHGEASLCEGELDGHLIECPFHQGTFDIRTGEAVGAPCRIALRTYAAVVISGQVGIQAGQ